MITNIAILVVGLFIGWNVPQPTWAQRVTAKAKAWWANRK